MTKARLLSTVAATLLLTAGIASAQDVKKDEAPAPAPAAQQSAPAEKVAPAMKPGEKKADIDKKAPAATTGQAPKASDADKPRADDKGAMDKGPAAKSATETKSSPDVKGAADVKAKTNDAAQAPAASKSTQSTPAPAATTGQGAAAGSAKLSTEQRTKISAVIKQQKVAPAKLNISISVGTRVPDSVRFYPLPQEVFVIYPEWRGYDYILVGNEILVVNPRTREIVAVLEA